MDRLDAAPHAELPVQTAAVRLGGTLRDAEPARHQPRAESPGQEVEDLPLAAGEPGSQARPLPGSPDQVAELHMDGAPMVDAEDLGPLAHRFDGGRQLVPPARLLQISLP